MKKLGKHKNPHNITFNFGPKNLHLRDWLIDESDRRQVSKSYIMRELIEREIASCGKLKALNQ